MKTIYLAYIFLVFAFLTACTKLERIDYTNIEEEEFFTTEADVMSVLTNYYPIGMLWWNQYWWSHHVGYISDAQSDMLLFNWINEVPGKLHRFVVTVNQNRLPNIYDNMIVKGISKGTNLISKVQASPLKEEVKKSIIAQIRALRCNLALWGGDVFGGVPIMVDAEVLQEVYGKHYVRRSTPAETCDFIVNEVDAIKNDLPDRYNRGSKDYGRATKGFVLTIKLKALMQQKRFVEAEATAREIMTLGYGLVPEYHDIFTIENEKNIETISSIPCLTNLDPSNNFNCEFGVYDYVYSNPNITPWGCAKMEWAFYDTFDSLDTRRKDIIVDYINKSGDHITRGIGNLERGAIVNLKYAVDPAAIGTRSGTDVIYFRYADVVLYLAEAINETSGPTQEALDLVNMIRARAFPDHPEKLLRLSDYGGDRQKFRDHIYKERGWELYFEGWRRSDMIRLDKMNDWGLHQNPSYNPYMQIWPIPPYIIDQSEGIITQNPGY